jgi:hypothetical protein
MPFMCLYSNIILHADKYFSESINSYNNQHIFQETLKEYEIINQQSYFMIKIESQRMQTLKTSPELCEFKDMQYHLLPSKVDKQQHFSIVFTWDKILILVREVTTLTDFS